MRMSRPSRGFFRKSIIMSNSNANTALATVDSLDAGAETISPVRGPRVWFDASTYYIGEKSKPASKGAQFYVTGLAEGWQKLQAGQQPSYIMKVSGRPAPVKPDVPESEWPKDLSGNPKHPWLWTRYLYLLSVDTGVTSTFTSNTIGGRIAIDELLQQIQAMRSMNSMRQGAIPIVKLESELFKTQFGMKPRPHFAIQGWRCANGDAIGHDDDEPEQLEHQPEFNDDPAF